MELNGFFELISRFSLIRGFVQKNYFWKLKNTWRLSWQQRSELFSTLLPLRLRVSKKSDKKQKRHLRPSLRVSAQSLRNSKTRYIRNFLQQALRFQSLWQYLLGRLSLEVEPVEFRKHALQPLSAACRSCKPAFFPNTSAWRTCGLNVCPYCHARRVHQYFKRVAYALHANDFCGALVLRSYAVGELHADVDDNLEKVLNSAKLAAAKYAKKLNHAHAGTLTFVRLLPGTDWNSVTIRVNQLFYFPDAERIPKAPQAKDFVKVVSPIKLTTAQRLVCRALQYPPSWIFRKPQYVLRVFNVLHDRSLITAGGDFYKIKQEEIDGFDLRSIAPIHIKTSRQRVGKAKAAD
jgi:hypothetical protein